MTLTHITEINKLLPWLNGRAEPWDYTTSHSVLRIMLTKPKAIAGADFKKGCVVLGFSECEKVMFSSVWGATNIEIREEEDRYGKKYIVSDSNSLYVECRNWGVTEIYSSFRDIPKLFES